MNRRIVTGLIAMGMCICGWAAPDPDVLQELRRLYVLHGLDLTTLRIKDFDRREVRSAYLAENMNRLKRAYPAYEKDPEYRHAGIRKKMIFYLLKKEKWDRVLNIYDR